MECGWREPHFIQLHERPGSERWRRSATAAAFCHPPQRVHFASVPSPTAAVGYGPISAAGRASVVCDCPISTHRSLHLQSFDYDTTNHHDCSAMRGALALLVLAVSAAADQLSLHRPTTQPTKLGDDVHGEWACLRVAGARCRDQPANAPWRAGIWLSHLASLACWWCCAPRPMHFSTVKAPPRASSS